MGSTIFVRSIESTNYLSMGAAALKPRLGRCQSPLRLLFGISALYVLLSRAYPVSPRFASSMGPRNSYGRPYALRKSPSILNSPDTPVRYVLDSLADTPISGL